MKQTKPLTDSEQNEAQAVFRTLKKVLDAKGWTYGTDEAARSASLSVQGDDLAIPLRITVDADRQRVVLHSNLPFQVPEARRMEGAVVTSMANFDLADGCFDYNIDNGAIVFRITNSYRGSLLGEELIDHMISLAVCTIDKFNERFLMVSQGTMTGEQFKAIL